MKKKAGTRLAGRFSGNRRVGHHDAHARTREQIYGDGAFREDPSWMAMGETLGRPADI